MKPRPPGDYTHARWCEDCGVYHGLLYVCLNYLPALRAEVEAANERYRRQVADGSLFSPDTPEEVKFFHWLFAGIR